jgi:hypothetical protein
MGAVSVDRVEPPKRYEGLILPVSATFFAPCGVKTASAGRRGYLKTDGIGPKSRTLNPQKIDRQAVERCTIGSKKRVLE